MRKYRKLELQDDQRSTEGDNLDSEEPPASYIVKLTAGNSTHFEDFEVKINSKYIWNWYTIYINVDFQMANTNNWY